MVYDNRHSAEILLEDIKKNSNTFLNAYKKTSYYKHSVDAKKFFESDEFNIYVSLLENEDLVSGACLDSVPGLTEKSFNRVCSSIYSQKLHDVYKKGSFYVIPYKNILVKLLVEQGSQFLTEKKS